MLILAGTTYLLGRHLVCIAGGLTTNELLLRKHKYAYLRDADGSFSNPFDDGIASNCLTFWSGGPRPDWYALYAKRSGGGGGGGWRPAWSVTALLQKWDASAAALARQRAEKVRLRQDALLARYGGVRREVLEAQGMEEGGGDGCSHGCCQHHHGGGHSH